MKPCPRCGGPRTDDTARYCAPCILHRQVRDLGSIEYRVFCEDGRKQVLRSKKPLALAVLQKVIGGYIELVRFGEVFFIVDEEGLLKNRVRNPHYPDFVGTVIKTTRQGVGE